MLIICIYYVQMVKIMKKFIKSIMSRLIYINMKNMNTKKRYFSVTEKSATL